jgi:hypothetical protein
MLCGVCDNKVTLFLLQTGKLNRCCFLQNTTSLYFGCVAEVCSVCRNSG